MSTMASPESIPPEVMALIEKCESCWADRRPRMLVCDYHAGFWDAWEAAQAEVELLRSVVRIVDPDLMAEPPDGGDDDPETWWQISADVFGVDLTAEQAEAVRRAMEER